MGHHSMSRTHRSIVRLEPVSDLVTEAELLHKRALQLKEHL